MDTDVHHNQSSKLLIREVLASLTKQSACLPHAQQFIQLVYFTQMATKDPLSLS